MNEPQVRLMGVPIDALTERQAVTRVLDGPGGVVVTPNLDHLRRFTDDAEVRRFYARADLILADGMPLVWASRIMGTPLPERVAGSNLILSLSEAAANCGASVFFLGGNPGVAETAVKSLSERFSKLDVAGIECPPIGFERNPALIDAIGARLSQSGARIVFVGLPLDKQIALIEPLRRRLPGMWFVGVGISFSFVSGDVARAPALMQRFGIEWVHRLVQEPRRLARRYLLEGIPLGIRLIGGAAFVRIAGVWRARR